MIKYRMRPNVLFMGAESQFDHDYLKQANYYGYEFYRTQAINPATGELAEGSKYIIKTKNSHEYMVMDGTQKILFAPDIIDNVYGSHLTVVPACIFDNLFEPIDSDESADLDTFEPEVAITDEQFRRGAIRACLFMESGCRNANDPHKATNVSGDRGGLTKYGITEKAYPNLDIRNLTYDDAIAIYERDYWPDAKADQLPRPLNALTYDLNVTSGPRNAMRILQRAVGATDDGLWGPKTKQAAWNACSTTPQMLAACRLFTEKRIAFYQAIVKNDSSQSKFLNGWINRAVRSQNFAQALLHTLDIL